MFSLNKIGVYGIRGTLSNWFRSHLSNRKQYVVLDGIESSVQTICGFPQRSTLEVKKNCAISMSCP